MNQDNPSEHRASPHPQDALFALEGKRVAYRHQGTIGIGFQDGVHVQIAIADGVVRVQRELPEKADLWLKCTRNAWESLLSGEGEIGKLLAEGTLRLAGDVSWLSLLANVCEPPKTALGVRLAAAS